jgi:hypothetical protein
MARWKSTAMAMNGASARVATSKVLADTGEGD